MDVMKKIFRYAALLVLLFCMGCSDWLDVRPKSQVKEDDLFTSESGFRGCVDWYICLDGTYGYLWRELHDGILGHIVTDLFIGRVRL